MTQRHNQNKNQPPAPQWADRIIVGLMSGTSVDAIDAAVVRIFGRSPRLRAQTLFHLAIPWEKSLRRRLFAAMAPAICPVQEICELNSLVAHALAAAAQKAIRRSGVPKTRIAAIASHGQTICHLPPGKKNRHPSTLQLGDPSIIATLTGITTVGNFRPADMAAGGQGAPLVPWADAVLLSDACKCRCVQNIGGIANVTFLPAGRGKITAFDTGPGNMLIDALVSKITYGKKTFDADGKMAARGRPHARLLNKLRRHPFFMVKPPKSTGREAFGIEFANALLARFSEIAPDDLICTATRLTAWSIAHAYAHYLPQLPDEIILCGGGADNPTLVKMLAQELRTLPGRNTGQIRLLRIDVFGIPNKAKEAASFALLAAATLDGCAANIPTVTGAKKPVLLGVVAMPGNLSPLV